MNSTVNKWQVLHFLLLSIMYTSPYFCSIQQVMNANGLKKHFCRLAVSRKTPVSTEQKSCQFPPYPRLNYPEQDLRSPSQGCWLARKPVEPRSFTLILVQWDLPKLQALTWPHLEAKAILWSERPRNWIWAIYGYMPITLCSGNRTASGLPWSNLFHTPDFTIPQVSLSIFLLYFAYGKWKFMFK